MGSSYIFGYTEAKVKEKASKRKMTLIEYITYLERKQKNRTKKRG
jgi:hypothetical protein